MLTTRSRGVRVAGRAAALAVALATAGTAWADTRTWDGGGADSRWTTPQNWAGDVAPSPGDDLVFPAGAARKSNTNDFPAGTTFASVAIQDSSYFLAGGAISLTGELSCTSGPVVVSLPVTGTGRVTKSGAGTLALEGANSFSGGVFVTRTTSFPRVELRHPTAAGTGSISADAGGSSLGCGVDLGAGVTVANPLSLRNGASTRAVTGTCTWAGPVEVSGSVPIRLDAFGATMCIAGTVSGTNTAISPTGNVRFLPSASIDLGTGACISSGGLFLVETADTAWGTTAVNPGTLRLGGDDVLPDGTTLRFSGIGGGNAVLDLAGFDQTLQFLSDQNSGGVVRPDYVVGNSSATEDSTLVVSNSWWTSPPSVTRFGGSVRDAVGTGTQTVTLRLASGTLQLTGVNSNSFTEVAGVLVVDGSIAGLATVESGGTIRGAGAAYDIYVRLGGTFVPGLTFHSLTMEAGSVLDVDVGSAGNAVTTLSGAATVAGTIQPHLLGGFNPTAGQTFTLLRAPAVTDAGLAVAAPGWSYDLVTEPGGMQALRLVYLGAQITAPAVVVAECDDGAGGATLSISASASRGTANVVRVIHPGGVTTRHLFPAEMQSATFALTWGPQTYPHGTWTVTFELRSGTLSSSVLLASATTTVHVEDHVAPALSGIGPKSIELSAPQSPVTPALLGVSADDACDPAPTVTLSPSALPLGTTQVTATARDATGNTAAATFPVTVSDTTPPRFTVVPADLERHCESGGALVTFDVLAQDLSGSAQVVCTDQTGRAVSPSGSRYGVGTHVVTCTATDGSGNAAVTSFTVNVVDDDAPVMVLPGDVVVGTEPSASFAYVAFAVTATDACDPEVAITTDAPWGPVRSGDAFPIGTTEVLCSASDRSGNRATASFHVTVEDREPPTLSGPGGTTLVTDCAGTPLSVSAESLGFSATDNSGAPVALTLSPSTLSIGVTQIVCTATDESGNAATRSADVTVLGGPFDVRFLRPLDGWADNVIQAGRTVPLRIRVLCENVPETDADATVDAVERLDADGAPVESLPVRAAGASSGGGTTMRPVASDETRTFELSTAGWPGPAGTRFRVTVRVTHAGHVDTLASVVLVLR